MLSSAGDLIRWQQALHSGRVLAEQDYRRMVGPARLANGELLSYGYGLMSMSFAGRPCVLHTGSINGFNAILVHAVAEDVCVAVLSSSAVVASAPIAEELLLAALGLPYRTAVPIPDELSDQAFGTFRGEMGAVVVERTDGKLVLRVSGRPAMRMRYLGQGAFGPVQGPALVLERLRIGEPNATWELRLGTRAFPLTAVRK